MQTSYYVTSDQYIPERMKAKIDKSTIAMTENGLHRFYSGFAEFVRDLRAAIILKIENETLHALSMNDLKAPLMFCSYLFGFACFIALVEVIIYHVRPML